MIRRKGITLTEVLVSIFVLAIGLLALLTLFPLGALNMGKAVQDSRCGQAAANGFAVAEAFNLKDDGNVWGYFRSPGSGSAPNSDGASYPVYVDPIGYQGNTGSGRDWVGGVAPGIRRRSPQFVESRPSSWGTSFNVALRYFTLMDDITFNDDGIPNSNPVVRNGRFSWAILLQRPRTVTGYRTDGNVTASVVDVTVVVYSQRPIQPSGLALTGETVYPVVQNSTRSLVVPFAAGQKPAIRKGGWILDNSPQANATDGMRFGPVHGLFYRVAGITESPTALQLELQTDALAPISRIVVMENVAEVFKKGPGWLP